ncbi:MAG: NAD(P)/FAD-dependent oxidoreductase [Candidatus Acidiferrales bacterium]
MDSCDILIVGAGPAGSSCAWKLRDSGLTTVILDKQIFPRDKVCGGWVTPPVLQELKIDLAEYARCRVLQPIHGFRISLMGGAEVESDYGKPISYGIRRCEFDDFLLKRCGARIWQGTPLTSLERSGEHWIVNDQFRARLVVGAGGHFCPVARYRGANARNEISVAAQETEFEMSESQSKQCSIQPELPELYFCPDMKGYGWCVRKNNFLNVGLGRLDPHALPEHVTGFLDFLKKSGKIGFDLPSHLRGHSYLLYGHSNRDVARDGVLLVGDSAGLAYSQSGEGIRPAVESGLLAGKAILAADGKNGPALCKTYNRLLAARFGKSQKEWAFDVGGHLPAWLVSSVSRFLLASRWFSRHVVLEQWFLHFDEPSLSS